MKITQPKIEDRPAQNYIGIRKQIPMKDFRKFIPQTLVALFAWAGEHNIAPNGPPFLRLHIVNMAELMDAEIGLPVGEIVTGDDIVSPGVVPAGRYASLIYTGNGIKANGALLDWGAANGLTWDAYESDRGDGFVARLEYFLTDPAEQPDRKKWQTEVAIKVKD